MPRLSFAPRLSVEFVMTAVLSRLLTNIDGTTAIEYGLIAAGVALAIIVAVDTLGQTVLTTQFDAVKNALTP